MNQTQCLELRDLLFAARFPSGHQENIFRYLAVTPGAVGDADAVAVVHFSYAPAVWVRAGEYADAEMVVRRLIALTPFAEEQIELQFHDYLRHGWPLPWAQTAKASHDNFPTLVLLELPDGAMTGVVMRDPHSGRVVERIAEAFAEPGEARIIVDRLRGLSEEDRYLSWYKEANIDAPSLEAAIASSPETEQGQKNLLLYRDNEWLETIWTNPLTWGHPGAGELHWTSVPDFHGTRASAAKRATRPGLDVVRQCQTLAGDAEVLLTALEQFRPLPSGPVGLDCESHPSIQSLCAWWNTNAPAEMHLAGYFRAYVWSERDQIFTPGDPEEPALSAKVLAEEGVYAVFDLEGLPPVVLQFYRGRAHNTVSETGGTQIYLANGHESMDIGLDPDQVDDAYYAVKGLESVHRRWR